MTTNMEPNGTPTGGQASQPGTSAGTTPASAVDSGASLEKVLARLDALEKGSQSVKDKRIAGIQGSMEDFKHQLSELRELMQGGLSEAAALRLMSAQQPQPPPAQVGNPGGQEAGIDISSVISAMNLDANDPQVIQVLRNEKNNTALFASLTAIANQKKASTNRPVPIGQQMPSPGTSPQTETRESIAAELATLILNPSKNMAKIRELEAKLRSVRD